MNNVKSLLNEAMQLSIEQSFLFDDLDVTHDADVYLLEKGYCNFGMWESPYCCYNSILKKLYCAFLILLLKENAIKGSLDRMKEMEFEDVLFSSGHYNRKKTASVFYRLYQIIENSYGFETISENICFEDNKTLSSVKRMIGSSKQAKQNYSCAREYMECTVFGEAYYCFSEITYHKENQSLYDIAMNLHYSSFSTDGLKRKKGGKYMLYNIAPTMMASNGYYDIEVEMHDGWYFTLHSLLAKILISVG